MSCLSCDKAYECHNEYNHNIAELQEGLKYLKRGALMQSIETLELLLLRLHKQNDRKMGRD